MKKSNSYSLMLTSIIFILLITSFVLKKENGDKKIVKISVESTTPHIRFEDKKKVIFYEKRTLSVYYVDDYIIYEFPAFKIDTQSRVVLSNKKGYFVHKNEEKYGTLFPIYNPYGQKQLVDSVLRLRAFKGVDKIFEGEDITILRENIMPNGNKEEVFVTKYIKDRTYPDTMFCYYSNKLSDVNYSFSKKMDRVNNSKLFKIRGIFNAQIYEGDSIKLSSREFLFEMKKDTNIDKIIILGILNSHLKINK